MYTELDEDKTDIYYSDPEGPYMDKPLADEDWWAEYNRKIEENERRNQELQNCFDRIVGTETWWVSRKRWFLTSKLSIRNLPTIVIEVYFFKVKTLLLVYFTGVHVAILL